jgi:hypothetical protein
VVYFEILYIDPLCLALQFSGKANWMGEKHSVGAGLLEELTVVS